MSLTTLQTALDEAKKVYKADKTNKAAKKAYKAAKEALATAQAQPVVEEKAPKKKKRKRDSSEPIEAVKKTKTHDIEGLTAALASAKAAHKADKKNATLKKTYKDAKAALAAAQATASSTEAPVTAPTEVIQEETKASSPLDDLKSLKKNTTAPAAKEWDANANPPNPSVYCGNLSYTIDEKAIKEFFKDCGEIVDINWLTDKETQDFLGRGFVTFDSTENATKAIETYNETECLGRPMYLSYSKPRNNARKPKGNGGKNGQSFVEKPLSKRPENCTTAFVGNVSFEIDDDKVYEFAKDCGDIKAIRWLTDRETGEFKGCGFVEFFTPEDVDKFVQLRGQNVMGRPIRIDYSAPRARD